MSHKYLLSRTLDPIFALSMGVTAAWLRIRREERARYLAASPAERERLYGRADANAAHPPTAREVWATLHARLARLEKDPRRWEWRRVTETKERSSWGIVEPGQR